MNYWSTKLITEGIDPAECRGLANDGLRIKKGVDPWTLLIHDAPSWLRAMTHAILSDEVGARVRLAEGDDELRNGDFWTEYVFACCRYKRHGRQQFVLQEGLSEALILTETPADIVEGDLHLPYPSFFLLVPQELSLVTRRAIDG